MDSKRDAQRRPDDVWHHGDAEHARVYEAKRNALRTDIAARLRPVCRHLTDDEFTELVRDVADTRLRFAAIDARAWPRRDGDDPATADPPAPTDI